VIEVNIAQYANEEVLADINHLLPQLSSSAKPMSLSQLHDLLDSPAVTLFLARREGRTVGMTTLALFALPTGVRAWIEDVVVDAAARGEGAGEALVMTAVNHARRHGAVSVDLTSRPSREAANSLYRKLGFQPRETNVYRYSFDD
jgi:ribosomal protein S18 acetylase RimI-like enzyme